MFVCSPGLIGLIMYRSKKTENFRKYQFLLYFSCFSVKIFGYEADKIIRRPHRFLFFIFKLFYLLKCNARHTGFLDSFGIIFQKNGQKTLFLPLYCWLNTSVSFWNIKPLQNQKKCQFFGKTRFLYRFLWRALHFGIFEQKHQFCY